MMLTPDQEAAFVENFRLGQYMRHDPDAGAVRFSDRRRPGFVEGYDAEFTIHHQAAARKILRERGLIDPEDIFAARRREAVIADLASPTDEDRR